MLSQARHYIVEIDMLSEDITLLRWECCEGRYYIVEIDML